VIDSNSLRWKTVRLLTAAMVCAVLSGGAAQAQGDSAKREAFAVFKEGKAHFDRGEWPEAIALFQKSYEIYPAPELLYSIAQAYRNANDCPHAIESFRLYLEKKPDASNRGSVEQQLANLEARCAAKAKEDEGSAEPTGEEVPTAMPEKVEPGPEPATTASVSKRSASRTPFLVLGAEAGVALFRLGDEVDPGARPLVSITAAYPMSFGALGLEVGARASFTQVPWEDMGLNQSGDSSFTTAMAHGAVLYRITSRLRLRGEVGAGVLVVGNVDQVGNSFVAEGYQATGAFSLAHARVALGASFDISDAFVVTASPLGFSYSPRRDNMRDSISSVQRFEMLVGLGYRL